MKNKIIILMVFVLCGFLFSSTVFADTSINLQIKTKTETLYDQSIIVTPCDSDNNTETPDIETPYCAINQSGIPSVWDWSWAPGAFVTSVNSIAGSTTKDSKGADVYHYWSWSLGGSVSMDALNQYVLKEGDSVLLEFIDPIEEITPPVTEEIVEAPVVHRSSGGYASNLVLIPVKEKVFNTENAYKFLINNQKKDGSFGESLYTNWVAVAVGGDGPKELKDSLIKFLKDNDLKSSLLTDNERHAMALMALNINPYNGTKVNYIKKIVDSFDGVQFGDKDFINDDIFALIVLKNAGYNENDEIILKDINYLISKQSKDGSWGSIDMTVAYIESMKGFENVSGVADSISKSKDYIISNQKSDGSFDNIFSASWVMQSLSSNDQILKTEKYLASKQETDGGVESISSDLNTRVWATSYSIPAIMRKSWGQILQKFPKEELSLIDVQKLDKNTPETVMKKENKKKEIENTSLTTGDNLTPKIEPLQDENTPTKMTFPEKLDSFWSYTRHSFRWLLDKLSF